jgi:hypothetical protein
MEYISESPITREGKLLSAMRFEKVHPIRFVEIVDGLKNSAHLIALSISTDNVASILFNPLNEEDKNLFAGFLCRSHTITEFFEDILKRAEKLKEDNF